MAGRSDIRFLVHEPFGFKYWNEQLVAGLRSRRPRMPKKPLSPDGCCNV